MLVILYYTRSIYVYVCVYSTCTVLRERCPDGFPKKVGKVTTFTKFLGVMRVSPGFWGKIHVFLSIFRL